MARDFLISCWYRPDTIESPCRRITLGLRADTHTPDQTDPTAFFAAAACADQAQHDSRSGAYVPPPTLL